MSPRPFARQEHDLLTELADLFARRAETERSLAARLEDGLAAAGAAHERAIGSARAAHRERTAEAVGAYERVAGEIRAEAEERLGASRRSRDAEVAAFDNRTVSLAEAINARLQEQKWLAETMLDSGEGKARLAFESARKSIGTWGAALDTIEAAAQTALAQARYEPMPPGGSGGVPVEGADGDGMEALEQAVEAARAAAHDLERAMRPRWLEPLGVIGIMLLVAAAAGAGWSWPEWGTRDAERIALRALPAVVAGALGGIGVVLLLRERARRRVPGAAAGLRAALDGGRRAVAGALAAAAAARDAEAAALRAKAEREWADAQAAVARAVAEVEHRKKVLMPALRARYERAAAEIVAERDRRLEEAGRELEARRAALDAELAAAIAGADREFAEARREVETGVERGWADLEREWASRMREAGVCAAGLVETAERLCPAWGSAAWAEPAPAAAMPPGVRFGVLHVDLAALPGGLPADPRLALPGPSRFDLPLMVDLLGDRSVLIRAEPECRGAAIDALNNIVLRLLAGMPPGKVRFTLVDPVGLGQSFAGLMHLSDDEPAIVGERIWTEPRHIEQRLADLTEHMETVIQKYLRNEYQTIQAYNADADRWGGVAEPYRFLVIADLPSSITEAAAKRLASIAASGARCGVFILAMTTQGTGRAAGPGAGARRAGAAPGSAHGFPWEDLERQSLVLHVTPGGVRWPEGPFGAWPVTLEAAPGEAEFRRLIRRIGAMVKDSTRVQVPFSIVEPPEGELWSGDAAAEVRLPLGRAGAKKLQYLTLGRGTAQHALIAGRTGSGKSTLLHVIITTAALWYAPGEVELYLVDFKKGVEFKTYAAHGLPHARVVAIESEREFGLSVLRRLDAELTRRGALFREAGVQDLGAYRRAGGGAVLPRVLLIVDEFQEFFVEDDRLAQDAALLLDRLVRQGRAFGMHVILGSQTLGGAYTLARSTLGQMAVRIALQCSEADSYLILSEDNPASRLLSRPGEAIYNDASGMLEGNSPFQVVWLDEAQREAALGRVLARARREGRAGTPPIVFEGNVPGDMSRNAALARLIDGAEPARAAPVLWLGDPIAIKEPTGVVLRHQSAANTLVVGNQDGYAAAIAASAVLSLAAWVRAGGAGGEAAGGATDNGRSMPAITLLDATPPDLPEASLLPRLVEGLGARVARLAGPRRVGEVMAEIAAEVERRAASGRAEHPPLLLVVHGLHRFRDLRKADEYSFSGEAEGSPTPARLLSTILRSGPSVGVHALVWCDTATSVDRMLERSALREFSARVLMQMSAGDSTQLIDGPQAAALGMHRALLYRDDTGEVEKFRLYGLPDRDWMERVLRTMGSAGEALPAEGRGG
jgi:hypothetical protein